MEEDWRVNPQLLASAANEAIAVPDTIAARIRSLMADFGLIFGAMDFIVRPDGQWIFLEINEMGQFLWAEQMCPELPLLQAITTLLTTRDVRAPLDIQPNADRNFDAFWHSKASEDFLKNFHMVHDPVRDKLV